MADGQVPVVKAATAGLRFLQAHWRRYAVGALACGGAGAFLMSAQILYARDGGPQFGLYAIAFAVFLVVSIFYQTAILRHAVLDVSPGPAALDTGADAFRVLGASVIVGFAFVLALLPVFLLFSVVVGAAGAMSGVQPDPNADPLAFVRSLSPGALVLVLAAMVLVAGFMAWFYSRLLLAAPATIAAGRIMAFQTWRWTKGAAWRMFAALVLLTLPLTIATAIIMAAVQALTGVSLGEPQSMIEDGEITPGLPLVALVGGLQAALNALLVGVPTAALTAYLYQGLRPATADQAADAL